MEQVVETFPVNVVLRLGAKSLLVSAHLSADFDKLFEQPAKFECVRGIGVHPCSPPVGAGTTPVPCALILSLHKGQWGCRFVTNSGNMETECRRKR